MPYCSPPPNTQNITAYPVAGARVEGVITLRYRQSSLSSGGGSVESVKTWMANFRVAGGSLLVNSIVNLVAYLAYH